MKHVAGSAQQAHPAILAMRSRPLIRSPAQISNPDVGQRQSRLVLREYTYFCLPGTPLLSCDQTGSPCRPSRLTYAAASTQLLEGRRREGQQGSLSSSWCLVSREP